jgi:hypothetical protein
VGVGVVDPGGGDLEELLALAGCRVGELDDVEDLGTAEAGDLHGSHALQARADQRAARWRFHAIRGRSAAGAT